MHSKERLLKAGFTVPQADAILDVVVAAQKLPTTKPIGLENTVAAVQSACDTLLEKMEPGNTARGFIESLRENVEKYGKLTPKQLDALGKFWAKMEG